MNRVQVLMLALVLASPSTAQEAASHKMDFNKAGPEALPSEPVASTAIVVSEKGREKVFDKKFFALMGALGGEESLRFSSRKLVIEREYEAGAPWITSVPDNQKDLLLFSSEFFVAYEMKKSHDWLPGDRLIRKFWWAYPAVMTVIHIKNGVGNIRTQGPGGCTSIECAMQMQTP